MYRHYITIDEGQRITGGWSAGELPGIGPGNGGILLTKEGSYCFSLLGMEHPPLYTEDGLPLYRWTGHAAEARTEEELDAERAEIAAQKAARERESRIAYLKGRLADTDYVVIKIAEGAASREDYAALIAQRQAWREEINELEGEENYE